MDMITTDECERCQNGTLDESNPAKIMVWCGMRERWYIYGKCIPCESFVKKREE